MRKKLILRCLYFSTVICIGYFIGLIMFNLYTPQLGSIDINIHKNTYSPETQEITLSPLVKRNQFFFVVYEESKYDDWLYFSGEDKTTSLTPIIQKYIASPKTNYLIFSGNEIKDTFTFKIRYKHPLQAKHQEQYVFHVLYIVPFKILFFPPFYFTEHFVFFIDPII